MPPTTHSMSQSSARAPAHCPAKAGKTAPPKDWPPLPGRLHNAQPNRTPQHPTQLSAQRKERRQSSTEQRFALVLPRFKRCDEIELFGVGVWRFERGAARDQFHHLIRHRLGLILQTCVLFNQLHRLRCTALNQQTAHTYHKELNTLQRSKKRAQQRTDR